MDMDKPTTSQTLPEFLESVAESTFAGSLFPLQCLLDDSVFYPAAGFDGTPVRYLLPLGLQSFIYCDWSRSRNTLSEALDATPFRGYRIIAERDIRYHELTANGFVPKPPLGVDASTYAEEISRSGINFGNSFCRWIVFGPLEEQGRTPIGPRFSLLYLRSEGVATYQALFNSNGARPAVFVDARPGLGFGGNYQTYYPALLEVMKDNKCGLPKKLLQWHSANEGNIPDSMFGDFYGDRVAGPWRKDDDPGFSVSLYNLR